MAKHIEKFTAPYRESVIPFLLAEVLTDGQGTMVDLVCRFINSSACTLLDTSAEALLGKRFTRIFPSGQLEQLSPLQTVAFSGSSASFSYTTVLGHSVQVICYQPMYGMVGCIIDHSQVSTVPDPNALPTDQLPGVSAVLELSRAGVRCLSFSQRLCALTGREHRELLDFYADDFSTLVLPEDWPDLLQALLDGSRSGQRIDHTFRLLRKDKTPFWVQLRAELLSRQRGVSSFSALLLDVDAQHRLQERQTNALRQAEDSLFHFSCLFNGLPGGYCVFRQSLEALTPIRVSQGLSSLLGYSAQELQRRLSTDPLWRIFPADQEILLSAAQQAKAQGIPLRKPCRLRVKGGDIRWGLIETAWQRQPDGSTLVFAACIDVTAEKAAVSELEFRAKLCDLLLDDPRIISFDYDPATDTARIYRRDKEGHRTTRIIPEYLHDLQHSTVIHPEEQQQLAAAVKRASNHPTTDVVEYRGNYDGQGWRWYRVSWISLFDSKGNVYRLVGRAEDITRRKAAAQRFQELKKQLKTADHAVLAAVQLDLSDNRILDAKGGSHYLTHILFGNTADDCLCHIREQVPTAEQQTAFDQSFRRDALLGAFHQGRLRIRLEHRFLPGTGAAIWVESTAELIEDPDTGHTTAFCIVRDVDSLHRQDLLLNTLAARDYDLVLTVNAASGCCRSYGRPLPEELTYQTLSTRYGALLGEKAPTLNDVRRQLESGVPWTGPLPHNRPGTFCWSWLDEADEVLLLTIRDSKLSWTL